MQDIRERAVYVACVLAMVVLGTVAVSSATGYPHVSEDSRLWNCYLHSSDHVCGPEAPWHGFPSLFHPQPGDGWI